MNLLILGDSNSVLTGGYVESLINSLAPDHVQQLSVGATNSYAPIARLLESPCDRRADIVLYAYNVNDEIHLGQTLADRKEWLKCLHLLRSVICRLHPKALFVPMICSRQAGWLQDAHNQFSNFQRTTFAALLLPYIDIQKELATWFPHGPPEGFYKDPTHYRPGPATAFIGGLVAVYLKGLKSKEIYTRTSKIKYIFGEVLKECSREGTLLSASNRLMAFQYLRLPQGAAVEIPFEAPPKALILRTDVEHAAALIEIEGPKGSWSLRIATRHIGTSLYPFLYSAIPLFKLGFLGQIPKGFIRITAVTGEPDDHCYLHYETTSAVTGPSHLDVVGVLFAEVDESLLFRRVTSE